MLILGFPAGSGHRTARFAVTIGAEKVSLTAAPNTIAVAHDP
jgi:hypothetical protein